MEHVPDHEQKQVIDFIGGDALVLAPPGCGKTDVLTRRIIKAHDDYGVDYSDMLCLTFTNRASREMQSRVRQHIDASSAGLFIGNLHRFCTRFLIDNALISPDTSIIDEDDQTEIIISLCHTERVYNKAQSVARSIVAHANVLTKKQLCFPVELISHKGRRLPTLYRENVPLVQKYIDYKRQNSLIDYDDIINFTYHAMMSADYKTLKGANYPWIQVDEVQDLNPIQMAIISKLTDPGRHTTVYLGDERQSIFSFIGATLDGLQAMKARMRIFNFSTNYRSPKYLVDFINRYAETNLGVKESELPTACTDTKNIGGLMLLETHDSYGTEQEALIAAQTRQLSLSGQEETVGILARTNMQIETIAEQLDEHHLKYMKLTNRDRFKMVDYKTLYSHLAVVANEHRGAEWSRILYQTKTVSSISDAHSIVARFKRQGLSLTDMLRDDSRSYLLDFADALSTQTLVVFDTETTGLNVFEDDVIQISAIKIDCDGVIPGSEFDIIIRTDREIPPTLRNGAPNPMPEIYAKALKREFASAIDAFIEYVGDAILIGHNAAFDINIILNNIRRRAGSIAIPAERFTRYFDTLKIARLIDPDLRTHNLSDLIAHYHLEGQNTHRAIDDAKATTSLIRHLSVKMQPLLGLQCMILQSREVSRLSQRLRNRYKSYYTHTRDKLYSPEVNAANTLVAEIQWLYDNFVADQYIKPIPQFDYIIDLLRKVMIDADKEPHFLHQLTHHVHEMRTFNESDLYHNGIVREKIHLMTIHKAKGLQFDNVFVYSTNEIPHSMDYLNDYGVEEAARLLYVAISRAKKRLFLCCNHLCSKFIDDELQQMCIKLSPEQISRILQLENVLKELGDL